MRFALPTLIIVIASACGHTPSRLGVIVEDVAVTRSRLGPSATDVALREFMPGSTRRVKEADVLGDDKPERLIESADHKGLEIRTQSGDLILQIRTDEYLTDFGAIPTTGTSKRLIVLYTYPNSERGGTFTVMNAARKRIATWDDYPPPGRFGVGEWSSQPALFYLQGDALIIRSPTGARLQELPAPEGHLFRSVQVQALAKGRTVVVASGGGYTPYHMVCIYDSKKLLFQEVQNEHAFGVDPIDEGFGFVVTARTDRWKYSLANIVSEEP